MSEESRSGAQTAEGQDEQARPNAGAGDRTAAEIRADIDIQQAELSSSMEALRTRVSELSDWRRHVREHRTKLIAGAAVAGFVVGGLIALTRKR